MKSLIKLLAHVKTVQPYDFILHEKADNVSEDYADMLVLLKALNNDTGNTMIEVVKPKIAELLQRMD